MDETYKAGAIPPQEDDSDHNKDGFMEGYLDDDEVIECAECGSAVRDKGVTEEIEGEKVNFCSKICAEEYAESLA